METLTYPSSFETKKDVSLVFLIKSKRIKKPQQTLAGFLGKSACGMMWSWPQKWLRHSAQHEGEPTNQSHHFIQSWFKGDTLISQFWNDSINQFDKGGITLFLQPLLTQKWKGKSIAQRGHRHTSKQRTSEALCGSVDLGRSSFPPCLLSLQESGNPTP